ncbi:MAG TPA: S8 family serine peptidase [Steroidobacteraceae bacterium]|nr:S8 family serine peptidase [Steroidobacteraceae bacterium]
MWRITPALVASLAAAVAHAQLGVSPVRVPLNVPLNVPQVATLDRTLRGVDSQLNNAVLQNARSVQVRTLIRRNRATLEADPNGAAIVRNEIVALSPSDADLALAQTAGFGVAGVRTLDGLDGRIVILQAPLGLSTARALARLRTLLPAGQFDFNHVYSQSGAQDAAAPAAVPADSATVAPPTISGTRVGLIDGGIDDAHPVFHDVVMHRHGCGAVAVPSEHGTAVASLMVGRSSDFHGAAPGAELYAGDVYCGVPTGGAVDAVADALAWMVHERVPVINVSLVGPPNVILESVVRLVIARGFIIVAAVGNDGPAAPPLYPASYPGVVGVTAVDAHRHALVEAARGPQVRFAAPGADMVAAKSPQGFEAVRGTSFAAPLVACLLAAELREPDQAAAVQAISDLAARAIDLGAHGLDPQYGYGLVAAGLGPDIRLAGLRAH